MVDTTFTDRQKYKLLDQLLKERFALVHINCAASGVVLPAHLLTQPATTLRVSRNFKRPISLEKDSFFAELLFGQEYFACVVPWTAVWGMSSGEREGVGQMWPESAPKELAPFMDSLDALSKLSAHSSKSSEGEQVTAPRATELAPTVGPPEHSEDEHQEKPKRPFLKRVK